MTPGMPFIPESLLHNFPIRSTALCLALWVILSSSTAIAADEPPQLLTAGRDAGFVEPSVCASCHEDIAIRYQKTGMGRSFFRLTAETAVADFSGQKPFHHGKSRRYYLPYMKDGRYFVRRYQQGPEGKHRNVIDREIHYVLGSGNHARGYIHRTPQNRLLQLPLTWYSDQDGFWEMAPGYDQPAHPDFRREVDYECMSCHNGYPEIPAGADAGPASPIFAGRVPEGIDCQRCHGPGRAHVLAAQEPVGSATLRSSIINPARLPLDRQIETCMQCHLETTSRALPHSIWRYDRGPFSHQPGRPLSESVLHFDHAARSDWANKFEVVNAVYRLRKSACFLESEGAMTCTTCHDPHNAPRGDEARQQYSNACLGCHQQDVVAVSEKGDHPSVGECLSCHMPKRRAEDAVHVRFTDHLISRRPAAEQVTERKPYQGEVVLYYPPGKPATIEDELYLAVAQVKDHVNLKRGIGRLQSLLNKHAPTRPEFQFELGEAYRAVGGWDQAIRAYKKALVNDRTFWPASLGLGLASIAAGDVATAVDALEEAVAQAPDEPSVLNALGDAYYRARRLGEAVTTLQKARTLHPDMAEPCNNLGVVYAVQSKATAAQAMFREAIRLRPDYASAHRNLASLLAPRDIEAAMTHLQEAGRLEPDNLQFHFELGVLTIKTGDTEGARHHLERAAQSADPALRKAARAMLEQIKQ